MRRTGLLVAGAALVGLLAGCVGGDKAVRNGQINDRWTDASDTTTLRFRGLGISSPAAIGTTQRMALARQAAQTDARAQATAYLKGIRIRGAVEVKDAMLTRSEIQGLIDRVIAGLVEERVEWLSDGGAYVVMAIDRKRVDQMVAQTTALETADTAAR